MLYARRLLIISWSVDFEVDHPRRPGAVLARTSIPVEVPDGSIDARERRLLHEVLAASFGVTDRALADARIAVETQPDLQIDPVVLRKHLPEEAMLSRRRFLHAMAWRDGREHLHAPRLRRRRDRLRPHPRARPLARRPPGRAEVSDVERERILAQSDVKRIERWLEKVAVATSLAEVLDEPR